jgi:hypothetical protein
MVARMRTILATAIAILAAASGCGGGAKNTSTTTHETTSRPPADATLKPAGTGWFCTTPTAGPRVELAGGCFRDEQTCNDTIATPFEDGTVYGPCTAQPTAFCHTQLFVPGNTRDFACSPTQARCDLVSADWANPAGSDYRDVSICAAWD